MQLKLYVLEHLLASLGYTARQTPFIIREGNGIYTYMIHVHVFVILWKDHGVQDSIIKLHLKLPEIWLNVQNLQEES